MTGSNQSTTMDAPRELVITRVFDAPRALVWQVWTDSRHVAEWWRPDVFTIPFCELDVRPGGTIRLDMQAPDGTVLPMTGVYHEVVEPERLVFVTGALHDASGAPQLEVLNTITFADGGSQTEVTLHLRVLKADGGGEFALLGMEMGWNQSLDKLGKLAESLV